MNPMASGEEWTVRHFRAVCKEGRTKWLSCEWDGVQIPVGESREVDGTAYRCLLNGVGIRVEPVEGQKSKMVSKPACEGHEEGAEWRAAHFRKRCTEGRIQWLGCYAEDDTLIPLGQRHEVKGFTFECLKTSTGVKIAPVEA